MRALRILLIVVVVLGGLFVAADRLAVNLAEDEVAEKLKTQEDLAATPDVSINGFPFLTQVAGGELDDVEATMDEYAATAGGGTEQVRIDDLKAHMKGVEFSGDYSSATAATVSGTATVSYDELMKAAGSEPVQITSGVTAGIVGLSDGGDGKIDVAVQATVLGTELPEPIHVLSSVTVDGDKVGVTADDLPSFGEVDLSDSQIRQITDFQQVIDQLPGGIRLAKVEAAKDGVEISVTGSNVRLAG